MSGCPLRFGVVLAGGRSSRMGLDKLTFRDEAGTVLQHTCAAAGSWADRVIVAGPHRTELDDVEFVVEEPRFGGPVAGLAAALAVLPRDVAGEVLLLAGDLVHPERIVRLLVDVPLVADGVVLVDDAGWRQYLSARYRLAALREAIEAAPEVRDVAVKRVLRSLAVVEVPVGDALAADMDTPEDARREGFFPPGADYFYET